MNNFNDNVIIMELFKMYILEYRLLVYFSLLPYITKYILIYFKSKKNILFMIFSTSSVKKTQMKKIVLALKIIEMGSPF